MGNGKMLHKSNAIHVIFAKKKRKEKKRKEKKEYKKVIEREVIFVNEIFKYLFRKNSTF